MPVLGNASVSTMLGALADLFGQESFRLIGELCSESDAIGFKFQSRDRVLLSVSTHAGQLPFERYDLQVSISDESADNGDILVLEEVDLVALLKIAEGINHGTIA